MDGGRSLTKVLSEMWRKKQMPKSSYLTEAVYSCLRMTACIPFKYSKLELLRNTYVHATCYSSSPTPSYDACHAPTVRELIFCPIHYAQTTENIWFWYLGHLKRKGSLGWFLEMCTSIHQIILSIPGKECLLNWHCLLHHLKFDITQNWEIQAHKVFVRFHNLNMITLVFSMKAH